MQTHHHLTTRIKNHFVTDLQNDFIKRLLQLLSIKEVQIDADDHDDPDVIVVFGENDYKIASIVFTDKSAWVEIGEPLNKENESAINATVVNVPFYYNRAGDVDALHVPMLGPMVSTFSEYGIKGMDKLFDDILDFLQDVIDQSINWDTKMGILAMIKATYTGGLTNFLIDSSRIYKNSNQTLAAGKNWKEKYIGHKKTQTQILGKKIEPERPPSII